jgi:NAD(P)H dehydrogenase (quinone)
VIKPRVMVTGATGKTGSVVVSELLKAGYPVRALVHREDIRSARLQSQGAEIAVADLSDSERVAAALKDVQRAYFCPPYDPYMIQGAVAFAVAAKEARVEHIVGLSQWLASPSHPSLTTRQSWLVDRLFSMTPGVGHTIVNPGFFADAYLLTIGLAHLGMFPWIFGNSRNAPPSNEDIARVAVAALIDPARHAGKSYRPTGPELLGADEMAKAIGRAVGRSVRAVPTPVWRFMKAARMGAGLPIELLSNVRYYIDDHKRGAFELGAPTTDVFDVTGRPPEDFETIARRYAALPYNRRTAGNWLRQFAQFMIAPLSSGFNFDRYDRELRRPFPSNPQFAPDSKLWRREHAIPDAAERALRDSVTQSQSTIFLGETQ